MVITARRVRAIRRAAQRRSHNPGGMGVSELFQAPLEEIELILQVKDERLLRYLLGYGPNAR